MSKLDLDAEMIPFAVLLTFLLWVALGVIGRAVLAVLGFIVRTLLWVWS